MSEEQERQQLATRKTLEQWIKHRSLPSDENLHKLWQRLQAHVRNVAHMHRPPPQKESTLTNNMVEHPRHVAEQYRAIPTITSLPSRTLYLGGPGHPEDTGGGEATGKEDSEGEQKKNKDVMTIVGRWEGPPCVLVPPAVWCPPAGPPRCCVPPCGGCVPRVLPPLAVGSCPVCWCPPAVLWPRPSSLL